MKILIVNNFGKGKVKDTDILPSLGHSIDMFYRPHPIVKSVLLWPSEETLKGIACDVNDIDAIVTVE